MRRLNFRYLFIILFIGIFVFYNLYKYYPTRNKFMQYIKCRIYSRYNSKCVNIKGKVYIPISEILTLFDTFGYFDKSLNMYFLKPSNTNFVSSNSYNYNSSGKFLFFDKYDVDIRNKVKSISIKGVPISSQWSKKGYYYPIQIAQYGLSHFSKWLNIQHPSVAIQPLNLIEYIKSSDDPNKGNVVNQIDLGIYFKSSALIHEHSINRLKRESSVGINVKMEPVKRYINILPKILSDLPELFLTGQNWILGSGIHFLIKNPTFGYLSLVYLCGHIPQYQENHFLYVYVIENCTSFKLVRNLYVDIIKLMPFAVTKHYNDYKTAMKNSEIESVTIFGRGNILVFQISNQFSYEKFIVAADWFVENQDEKGGWPTNVTRRIYSDVTLAPGWYSAMAQGHALSLLTRAYSNTKKSIYLKSATRALKLFEIDNEHGGIAAKFLGRSDIIWYEEYPTKPSLFILNGFLYSLFGLLDFSLIKQSSPSKYMAGKLFHDGIQSLKILLPLYDSGFGSFYDLRHLTFPYENRKIVKNSIRKWEVPDGPNRARWEYHLIHIEQLLFLANCFQPRDEFLMSTAQRFRLYLKGYRSSHN